jgi:hypothetical protein
VYWYFQDFEGLSHGLVNEVLHFGKRKAAVSE